MELKEKANNNLLALKNNVYPGRGIIVGMDDTGKYLVQVYWIMGRSENSRNRVFIIEENGTLRTAPFDPTKVKDSSLIIYTAMAQWENSFAVSNGHQTTEFLGTGFGSTLNQWAYEPDKPNYTPRISALVRLNPYAISIIAEMSILKRSPFNAQCDRYLYELNVSEPGLGYCVTTYNGDGVPLPSFTGDPYLLPLVGNIEDIAQTFWDCLNNDNKVSLAVKFIDISNHQISMTKRNVHEGD